MRRRRSGKPTRRPDPHKSREAKLEAILARCRVDANAKYARYDDLEGLVVTVSDANARDTWQYVFESVDQALRASASKFSVRRYRTEV